MRKVVFLLTTALLCCCFTAKAQSGNNIIKYISENKLYRNGNNATVTNIDMEWPIALDGDGMENLQRFLCRDALGVEASSLKDGLTEFRQNLGKEIQHMPDSVERHYLNIKLEELWVEHGQYVSFYLTRQETGQDGNQISGTKKFITYDLINNDTLATSKVFRPQYDDDESYYNRVGFETLVEQNNVCDESDKQNIDLTLLPHDFALLGNVVLFGLGGPVKHENFSTVSIVNLYSLDMLKRNFIKWLQGKEKNKRKVTTIAHDFDTSLSTDTINTHISQVASFPGGQDSLTNYLKENITYPTIDMTLHNQGRVVVAFIVEKDGSLSDLTVVNPLSPGLDREAVRVVRSMPGWTPAVYNGAKVRTRMTLPVVYRLKAN